MDISWDHWTAVGSGSTATCVTVVTHKSRRAPASLWSGAAMWTPPHALCPSYLSSLVTTAHLHLAYDTVVHHLQVDVYIYEHVHFSVQIDVLTMRILCSEHMYMFFMLTSPHGVHAHGYTCNPEFSSMHKAHLHAQSTLACIF